MLIFHAYQHLVIIIRTIHASLKVEIKLREIQWGPQITYWVTLRGNQSFQWMGRFTLPSLLSSGKLSNGDICHFFFFFFLTLFGWFTLLRMSPSSPLCPHPPSLPSPFPQATTTPLSLSVADAWMLCGESLHPLTAVSLFHVSMPLSLFCSLDSTYEWDQLVFVSHWLAYSLSIIVSISIPSATKGKSSFFFSVM